MRQVGELKLQPAVTSRGTGGRRFGWSNGGAASTEQGKAGSRGREQVGRSIDPFLTSISHWTISVHSQLTTAVLLLYLIDRLTPWHHETHMIPIEQHSLQRRLHHSLRCELAAYSVLLHCLEKHDICLGVTHRVVYAA